MPIVVVAVAALLAGLTTGFLAWHFRAVDPAAPRVPPERIVEAAAAHPGFFRARVDPEPVTGLLLTVALGIALLALLAFGGLLVMFQHNVLLARYDLSAARWGAEHAGAGSTRTLRDISLLGGTTTVIVVSVIVAAVEFRRTHAFAVIGFLAVVVVGAVILMNVTKYIVDRPRPAIDQLTGFSGSSFPSGHATFAAATFAAAAFLLGRGRSRRVKAALAAAAGAIAVGVATTRVLLGVHWLTDVLAGLALGWGWFTLCSIAFGGRVLRFGQPVRVAENVASATDAAPAPEHPGAVSR